MQYALKVREQRGRGVGGGGGRMGGGVWDVCDRDEEIGRWEKSAQEIGNNMQRERERRDMKERERHEKVH